jgi:thymidine kinase
MLHQLNGGYLKLIIGPMFSSKSSTLLSEINRLKYITDKILVINSVLDKERHSDMEINEQGLGLMKTHDNKTFPALMINKLGELKTNSFFQSKYNYADIIVIDEAQFYTDLYEFISYELTFPHNNKMFVVAGLSSDFNMRPIGNIINLVPLADEIVKLSALCVYCKDGTPANFTKLIKTESNNESNTDKYNNVLVGAKDLYSPCCRKHFLMF